MGRWMLKITLGGCSIPGRPETNMRPFWWRTMPTKTTNRTGATPIGRFDSWSRNFMFVCWMCFNAMKGWLFIVCFCMSFSAGFLHFGSCRAAERPWKVFHVVVFWYHAEIKRSWLDNSPTWFDNFPIRTMFGGIFHCQVWLPDGVWLRVSWIYLICPLQQPRRNWNSLKPIMECKRYWYHQWHSKRKLWWYVTRVLFGIHQTLDIICYNWFVSKCILII